jgi:hypothetical protein
MRAGVVDNLEELNKYPYCGHSALLGKKDRPWQDVRYVLGYFGKIVRTARKAYLEYMSVGAGWRGIDSESWRMVRSEKSAVQRAGSYDE